MLDSSVESSVPSRKPSLGIQDFIEEGGDMKYHGVDLHKKYATISVRNEEGTEEKFVRAQADMKGYVSSLGSEDSVVVEASTGALYWAEKIQAQGAQCVVIDAYRFRIIRDSWHKTDKRDATNLSLGLWLASRSGEIRLPEIWQPTLVVRELRRLFGLRVIEQASAPAEERDPRHAVRQTACGIGSWAIDWSTIRPKPKSFWRR
jgi:hypothetical protein